MSAADPRVAPVWARDLVIYELNPRAFTSPHGAGDGNGSGTFASMAERIPYLADLGVNGIWMAGHHVATDHFYGIWSVYAALEPDKVDPSLGTADDLRALIRAAHAHGIRMFLDVIAHGVLHGSPLVAQHPDWFATTSWGMADYNYEHPGFRAWWVDLWLGYALDYDIDGVRVDVAMGDVTVWDEIVSRLARQGKEIVVFPENESYHFSQQDHSGVERDFVRSLDTDDYRKSARGVNTSQLSCHDYGWESLPGNHFYVRGSRARAAQGGLLLPRIPVLFAGEEFDADPEPLPGLRQDLFGSGGPGGWLYGNRIVWSQLNDPAKAAMHADVKAMIAIRRRYARLLHGDSSVGVITRTPFDGAVDSVPFAVGIPGDAALIVVTNEQQHPVTTRILVPRIALGFGHDDDLVVTDAATDADMTSDGDMVDVTIASDRTPNGGYRVLHVTRRSGLTAHDRERDEGGPCPAEGRTD